MNNADAIRNMSDEELSIFIRTVYIAGRDCDGFAMFGYNLEEWLKKENEADTTINPCKSCQEWECDDCEWAKRTKER